MQCQSLKSHSAENICQVNRLLVNRQFVLATSHPLHCVSYSVEEQYDGSNVCVLPPKRKKIVIFLPHQLLRVNAAWDKSCDLPQTSSYPFKDICKCNLSKLTSRVDEPVGSRLPKVYDRLYMFTLSGIYNCGDQGPKRSSALIQPRDRSLPRG